jgi:NADH-quinone oxidoreductase subunit J
MIALLAAASPSYAVPANIVFAITAVLMTYSAIRVVTAANVVHAAAFLVVVLSGVAVNFILLGAEFLALTQVLVYIGAIVVLFLFGVMLTRAPMEGGEKVGRDNWAIGAASGLIFFALLAAALWDGFGKDKIPATLEPTSTGELSDVIFGGYLFPFEVISLLLLAALVGAIVIARRD